MKLLVDLGNSRIKWAWLERGALEDADALIRNESTTEQWLQRLDSAGHPVDEILVASVASPSATAATIASLSDWSGCEVRVARSEPEAMGVRNGYVDPSQLGVDRWLALLAAYQSHRQGVCVVDAGTALTIDYVAAGGGHRGGLIVPGPRLMLETLRQGTGRIGGAIRNAAGGAAGSVVWGRDTESCIREGGRRTSASLVTACVRDLRETEGQNVALVLTGGDAPDLLRTLGLVTEHRPLLVLEGLALRWARTG